MPFASALSVHPDPAEAVGEVVGEVLERLGSAPDLAVMFFTEPHLAMAEEAAATVQLTLDPATFVGSSARAVLEHERGVERQPAVALWAARLPGVIAPVHITAQPVGGSGAGWTFAGLPDALVGTARCLVLLADPFTFPVAEFLGFMTRRHPDLTLIGGMASAAQQPGHNRLLIGGRVARHGAVGVLLADDAKPTAVVSQGCRPVGRPYTVTRSERNVVLELGGRPALDRLMEILAALPASDREIAALGLQCGIVADAAIPTAKLDFERGDFLIRGVLGADRLTKSISVGDEVPVGATVQFQVRDSRTAGEDLRSLLAGHDADAALVFTCTGRGSSMFTDADHDATIVHDHVAGAVAGMFCAGELGPIRGRNALHGFTASVALFRG